MRADSRRTTESPNAEAVAWQRQPRQMPKVVKNAAVGPRVIAFFVTSPVSAPGMMVNKAAMPRKATKRESMMALSEYPSVDGQNRLRGSLIVLLRCRKGSDTRTKSEAQNSENNSVISKTNQAVIDFCPKVADFDFRNSEKQRKNSEAL